MQFLKLYLRQADPAPITDGNLFEAMADGRTARGGWQAQNRPLKAALVLGGLVAAGALLPARHSRQRN
jgi:hypothetical protein